MGIKVRHEINILDAVLSAGSGVSLDSSELILFDTTKYTNPTYYFEIVADSSLSLQYNVDLYESLVGIIKTITVPLLTTSYTRFRSTSFTPSAGTHECFVSLSTGEIGATKNVKSAKIIIIDSPAGSLTASETQIEIGNNETGKTNTVIAALTNPKYWLYTAANWDGAVKFYAEVVYAVASSKGSMTIRLEEDDGAFGSWATIATIVNGGTATTRARVRVAFTPTTGRHYRLSSLQASSKSSGSIYCGKIIVDQEGNGTASLGFVQSKSASGNAVTLNSTPTIGNLLVLIGARNSSTAVAAPDSSWNALTPIGGGATFSAGIFWKIAGASESATITLALASAMVTAAAEYSGNSRINTLNVENSQANASGTAQNAPTVTPTSGINGLLFGLAGIKNGSTFSLENFNNDTSGVTEREDVASTTSVAAAIWDKFIALTGTYDAQSTATGAAIGGGAIAIFNQFTTAILSKIEEQYLLLNTTDAGTGLQAFPTLWDTTEWDDSQGGDPSFKYSHDATNAADASKLVDVDNANADVTGSTVTGANEQISAAFTMPTTGHQLDTNVTNSTGVVGAVRILALFVVNTVATIPNKIYKYMQAINRAATY